MNSDLEVSIIFPSYRTLCPTKPSLQWVAWATLPRLHRYYALLRLPQALLDLLCFRSLTDGYVDSPSLAGLQGVSRSFSHCLSEF